MLLPRSTKSLPLRTPAINHLATFINVIANLLFAFANKDAYLFLALVNELADALGRLPALDANILGTLARTFCDVLAGFLAALGSVENTGKCADAQTCQEPCQSR